MSNPTTSDISNASNLKIKERDNNAASNLNLSSVLFASSATAFYSQTDEAKGTVYDGTAMTLRLDGGNKDIGFAAYDAGEGKIIAKKGKCSGRVVLMVQGNDGGSNWFYCSPELDSAVIF